MTVSINIACIFSYHIKGKGKRAYNSSWNSPQNYGTPLVKWDHTVLSATRQRWPPRLHPNRAGCYSIYRPRKDERLSWPSWLVTCRNGLPVHRRSPIRVLLLLVCVSFTIIGQPRNNVLIRRVSDIFVSFRHRTFSESKPVTFRSLMSCRHACNVKNPWTVCQFSWVCLFIFLVLTCMRFYC